jgi:hypothetical protein
VITAEGARGASTFEAIGISVTDDDLLLAACGRGPAHESSLVNRQPDPGVTLAPARARRGQPLAILRL